VSRADNLNTFMGRFSWNLGGLSLLETSVLVRDCKGIILIKGRLNDKVVGHTKLGRTQKNDQFTVCFTKIDALDSF